ncbi:MAG: hypothetical protein MUD12_09325 [Spirochaetes bacterium]|jgi:hypothetical protein|nr:hypothetical protein [Spirochaetota bacterium]
MFKNKLLIQPCQVNHNDAGNYSIRDVPFAEPGLMRARRRLIIIIPPMLHGPLKKSPVFKQITAALQIINNLTDEFPDSIFSRIIYITECMADEFLSAILTRLIKNQLFFILISIWAMFFQAVINDGCDTGTKPAILFKQQGFYLNY